jgi:hypothetical protein
MQNLILALTAMVVGIATLLFISFLLSWPVMTLWNECLMPAVTGIKEIGWMQAWGIGALCGILFKTSVTKKD